MAKIVSPVTSSYRGRLAPSPTGYLHVGHARTFWTAFERAREAGGALIMRMEDIDPLRSKALYAEAVLEDLRWLGIRWQEGPDAGGACGPYLQSRRRSFYLAAWRTLLQRGFLYPCQCSHKDVETGAPHEGVGHDEDEPVYPGTCRPRLMLPSTEHMLPGTEHSPASMQPDQEKLPDVPDGINWRFRVPDGEKISFVDQKLGAVSFIAGQDFGDFLIWRRDGVPSYQLACVADDAAMKITEVVRGADLLKSTARQILLNRALGFVDPQWFHCPLVVDHNGHRLAKRHDALSLHTLRQRGVTPMNIFAAELPVGE